MASGFSTARQSLTELAPTPIIKELAYSVPTPSFHVAKQQQQEGTIREVVAGRGGSDIVQTAEKYNVDVPKPGERWEIDVRDLIPSDSWLAKYGLKKNRLDAHSIAAQLGFQHLTEFDSVLKKPISSRYGDNLFQRLLRDDGKVYNITAGKEKLKQVEQRLLHAVHMYRRRMEWLTSESRRIFGVIYEHSVCIILDIKNMSPRAFDTYLCAAERVLKEQIMHKAKFNLIRCADQVQYFAPRCQPVTRETVQNAIDWLWQLDRLAPTSPTDTVEGVIRAAADPDIEAIYLFTEGSSSDASREILIDKVKSVSQVPFHVVAYNCQSSDALRFLRGVCELTGGRFHCYSITMEVDSFEGLPLDPETNKANIVLKRKLYGGVPAGSGIRADVFKVFEELEEARNLLAQVQHVLANTPDPLASKETMVERDTVTVHERKEEYMKSSEWLQRFGIAAKKLDFFDILAGVSFRHCDGVVHVMRAPEGDPEAKEKAGAIVKPKLINARYCDKFAHVLGKDGTILHVQMTPEVHRIYEERMNVCLESIQRRIDWLREGSRELFGTIVEDQVYFLIDTSASMEPSIGFVKDKLYILIQEQLRHKLRVNFVAFNTKAYPWKDRLVEVTEQSLQTAWNWIKALSCFGTTNTLAALKFALSDRQTHAVYLLTDGRPDQPFKTVLAQAQLHNRLPIHAISFNCRDREANQFLFQLARDTGARFHIFSDQANDGGPESWESEDIRLLREEHELGKSYLERVAALRDECHRLAWKRETDAADGTGGGGTAHSTPRYLDRPQSAPHRVKKTPRQPRSSRQKPPPQPQPLLTINADRSVDWVLPETREMLTRQRERDALRQQQQQQQQHRQRNKDMLREENMSSKQWLKRHGLVAQRMTILDALSPTIVEHRPKYVPILNRMVLARVFDDIMPIAYATPRNRQSIQLVNPAAVDLKAYRKKLKQLIEKYNKRLNSLILCNLSKEQLDELAKQCGSDRPEFDTNKAAFYQALEQARWPVSEADVFLLEKEVEKARLYMQQAEDLQRVSSGKETPDSTREILSEIQRSQEDHQGSYEGFGELVAERELNSNKDSSQRNSEAATEEASAVAAEAESSVSASYSKKSETTAPAEAEEAEAEATDRDQEKNKDQPQAEETSTEAEEDKASQKTESNSKTRAMPQKQQQKSRTKSKQKAKPAAAGAKRREAGAADAQQREAERRALDSLRGQRVIARNEEDGLYYAGLVECCPDMRTARIRYDELQKVASLVPTRFCIPICGALSYPILRTNDTVLAQVRNLKNRAVCFAPARVLVPPQDESRGHKLYCVQLYNGKKCQCMRSSLIKIGETRYTFLTRALLSKCRSGSGGGGGDNGVTQQEEAETERDREQRSEEVDSLRDEIRRLRRQLDRLQSAQDSESRGAQERIQGLERQIQQLQSEKSGGRSKHRRRHRSGHRRDDSDDEVADDGHQFEEIRDLGDEPTGSGGDRPPQRLEFRPADEETSSELARLASRQSGQDAIQPDDSVSQQGPPGSDRQRQRQRQLQQRQPPKKPQPDVGELKTGEEVLARWSDDGWYYRCVVVGPAPDEDGEGGGDDSSRRFVVEDGSSQSTTVDRTQIIRESDDAGMTLEHGSTVVALHPSYSNSYAPGVVIGHDSGTMWVTVRFYDGGEVRLPRQECYAIDSGLFEHAVEYIIHREKLWVDKAVVARVNRTGCYLPATVKNRVGSGRQYVVEFSDGHQAVQALEFIFGGLSRRCSLREGDRVLAQIASNIVFLPGWVMSVNLDSTVNVKFVDGSSARNVKQLSCYWLTKEFFDNAVSYWRNRHDP